MITSLVSGAVAALNAAGFLLMAAGPSLLEFIVISSIYSVASWIYSFILPAAIGYRAEQMPQLRLLQATTVAIAAALILVSHPGTMGLLFVAILIADAWIFPQHILLFRSETAIYLRMELARGLANSAALLAVFLFLEQEPLPYVVLLLVNVAATGAFLAMAGVHRPPSLRLSTPAAAYRQFRSRLFSRQLVALLSARGLETGTMIALSQIQALSPVLSLKIGIAVSSALAANARQRTLPLLWLVHLLVYCGGTAAILLLVALPIAGLPIPDTLKLITLPNAIWVLPVVLAAFTLTVIGLRQAQPGPVPEADPG